MTITEEASRLLESGPICDACLGRPFADRSFGLTNSRRGQALRTTLAMDADEPYETPEPADCWVCEGYCGTPTVEALADAVADAFADVSFESYQVGTRVPPLVEENDRLLREEAGLDPEAGESVKRELNREVGRRVGGATGAEVDFDRPDVLAICDLEAFDPRETLETGTVTGHAVDAQINPAFVYGRYRKLARDVPQTEWPCRECGGSGTQLADDGEVDCDYCGGSGYMYDESVEQLVRPHVVEAMDGEAGTFHGAGREDVDARMLGTGRPFVLEVTRPRRRRPDVEVLEAEINAAAAGTVEVEGLRLATYEMVERVKEHDASKRYRAAVAFDAAVDRDPFHDALEQLDGTTVEQYTPERVDHRRAGLTRERTVYGIDGVLVDDVADPAGVALGDRTAADEPTASTHAVVEIHGEGGLYVKELVSGDDGRTEPSLAGLVETTATVTALDVVAVTGETDPFEREPYFRDDPREAASNEDGATPNGAGVISNGDGATSDGVDADESTTEPRPDGS